METIVFKIDNLTKEEMDKFLAVANISRSNFIRICIIEKLARIKFNEEGH